MAGVRGRDGKRRGSPVSNFGAKEYLGAFIYDGLNKGHIYTRQVFLSSGTCLRFFWVGILWNSGWAIPAHKGTGRGVKGKERRLWVVCLCPGVDLMS